MEISLLINCFSRFS